MLAWSVASIRMDICNNSLPCLQGRVGVGLLELAVLLKLTARLLHPTLTLPYYT
jgi:hypothetical protein